MLQCHLDGAVQNLRLFIALLSDKQIGNVVVAKLISVSDCLKALNIAN
jgi:hypothetical protein